MEAFLLLELISLIEGEVTEVIVAFSEASRGFSEVFLRGLEERLKAQTKLPDT